MSGSSICRHHKTITLPKRFLSSVSQKFAMASATKCTCTCCYECLTSLLSLQLLFEADKHCQRELEAMRQRHRARFQEATADLRVKHKAVVKRMKALEAQLLRNSVSVCRNTPCMYMYLPSHTMIQGRKMTNYR